MPILVPKSKFKPKAFEYFRMVEKKKTAIYITDHGKAVLKLSPVADSDEDDLAGLRGLVEKYSNPMEPVDEDEWEALK